MIEYVQVNVSSVINFSLKINFGKKKVSNFKL